MNKINNTHFTNDTLRTIPNLTRRGCKISEEILLRLQYTTYSSFG